MGENVMYCPYCNKQISDNTQFCPHCGQTVNVSESKSVNNYWGEVNKEDRQRSAQYVALISEKEKIKNSRRTKTIVTAIVIGILIFGGIFGFVNIQSDSEKKLEQVKEYLPGNSYNCSYSQTETGFWIHYYYYKLNFNDDGTLDYYYMTTVGPKGSDDSYDLKGTYNYNITRSIFGNYEINVSGETFTLRVDDENIPESIKHGS